MTFVNFLSSVARGAYAYRGFIVGSVRRELQSKYRNSVLGVTWIILTPLATILVYTVVFSQIMRSRLPEADGALDYGIYLCAGVLTWLFFAEVVGRAQNMFLECAALLKKVNFPRICLPIIVVLNAGVNFFIIFGLFSLFLFLSGRFPGLVYLAIFPILTVQIMFSVGLGTILGVLNVFFRDVGQFFGMFLQFWFWLTPIVYPVEILPEPVRRLLALNPMVPLVQAYQGVLVHARWPDWGSIIPVALFSVMLCVLGLHLFRKHAGEIVDEL